MWELRLIDPRLSVINTAIAICLVVALLFAAELTHLDIGGVVAVAFITLMLFLMLLLTAGLIAFLIEIRLSIRAVHVRKDRRRR